MKKLLTLLMLVITVSLTAQDYPVTSIAIKVPDTPDANTTTWGSGTSVFTIQVNSTSQLVARLKECKMLVFIRKGGAKVCGSFTSATAPAFSFGNVPVKIWSGANARNLLGQDCTLTPGDYELCAQVFNNIPASGFPAVSREYCTSFTIKAAERVEYQPPQAISPPDGTVISEGDAKKPVTFRWIPVTPRPREEVIYKLRIFEVKSGQTAARVVKSALPLLEKEVKNQTQFILPSLVQLPVSKGSGYGWGVQALGIDGKPFGLNDGMSNINTMTLRSANIFIEDFQVTCSAIPGRYNFYLQAGNNGDHPFQTTGISISPNTPNVITNVIVLPNLPVIPANGSGNCHGTFDYSGTYPEMVVAEITGNQQGNANLTSSDTEEDTLQVCTCHDCDSLRWNLRNPIVTTQSGLSPNLNNTAFLTQGITVSPFSVINVKAEIVNFNWYSQFSDCKKCNTNDYYWGNLTTGTLNNPGFNPNGISPGIPGGTVFPDSHELHWVTSNNQPVALSGTINLNISLPPQTQLSCCTDCFRFCIRYSVTFIDDGFCKTCSMIKCYELIRKHQPNLPTQNLNDCGESVTTSSQKDAK